MKLEKPPSLLFDLGLLTAFIVALFLLFTVSSRAHEIYTGVYGKNHQLCCGGDDCAATQYREHGSNYEFLTREKVWVDIPADRITFLPIPGDVDDGTPNRAHLCYRKATDVDRSGGYSNNVFGDIYLYCAFIVPGGV